jgi:hypothetical protein
MVHLTVQYGYYPVVHEFNTSIQLTHHYQADINAILVGRQFHQSTEFYVQNTHSHVSQETQEFQKLTKIQISIWPAHQLPAHSTHRAKFC